MSIGTDGIVKVADPETGKVLKKWACPKTNSGKYIHGTALLAVGEKAMLVGTEDGNVYELNPMTGFTGKKWIIEESDTVSGMLGLPGKEGGGIRHVVVVGGPVLAVINCKKDGEIVKVSEHQEDDILSVAFCPEWPGKMNQRLLTGMGEGVAAVWVRGEWEDQMERIKVSTGKEEESVDSALYMEDMGLVFGLGNGKIKVAKVPGNKWKGEIIHDESGEDSVVVLDQDCYGRLVSACGETVKIWVDESEPKDSDEDMSDADSDSDKGSDSDSDSDQSSEEEKTKKRRKKAKGPPPAKAIKASFDGMD